MAAPASDLWRHFYTFFPKNYHISSLDWSEMFL